MMDELPTFLDPQPPHLAVDVDPTTGLMPSSEDHGDADRYPLVNVRKFRLVAGIVQKVLAFQESALSLPAEATEPAHLYLACLKIKALEGDQLRRLSLMCEPS